MLQIIQSKPFVQIFKAINQLFWREIAMDEDQKIAADGLRPIVQRLYTLAGLLQRWDGKASDNDILPGLGLLLADIATHLEATGETSDH